MLANGSVLRSYDRDFHLHGFDDNNRVAALYCIADLLLDLEGLCLQRRLQSLQSLHLRMQPSELQPELLPWVLQPELRPSSQELPVQKHLRRPLQQLHHKLCH
jgi:hypothetical protein